jgi:hypothetical protein
MVSFFIFSDLSNLHTSSEYNLHDSIWVSITRIEHCYEIMLKGMSHEIDLKDFDQDLHIR